MANRFGSLYRIIIGKETVLGSGKTNATSIAWTEVTVLPDVIEHSTEITPIQTNNKTNTGLPTLCETKQGYKKYGITLSGVCSHEHEILLKAFFKDTATPYVMDSTPNPLDGYVVARVWSDAPVSDDYTVDKASGCQLVSLNFSGQSGDMIRYEATFVAREWVREATQEITGTDPGSICLEGFNFGDLVISSDLSFGAGTALKSFSLTLTNEQSDDANQYQNSNTLKGAIIPMVTGELTYVTNYETAGTLDSIAETELNSSTAYGENFIFANATKSWEFDLVGQLTAYSQADPDRQIFDNNVTERLVFDGTSYPCQIVITSV